MVRIFEKFDKLTPGVNFKVGDSWKLASVANSDGIVQ
jgi:hypothetical protein